MACFWRNVNETSLKIPETEEIGAITFYKIVVRVGTAQWTVLHRYNEFYELHTQLSNDHGVSKEILPPKKVIRNKASVFIETRRKALEIYLENVLNYLKRTMPRPFVEFLHFHLYDVYFLLQSLAFRLYNEGEAVLAVSKSYMFNPLELHSINECFKRPIPYVEQNDKRYDFSHIMDFCCQLCSVVIEGSWEKVGESNIVPNYLPFELSYFRSLKTLKLIDVKMDKVCSVENLRTTVEQFSVQKTTSTNISQILQCDIIHKNVVQDSQIWSGIIEMDLGCNNITEIDDSIKLTPNVKVLTLSGNKISGIANLTHLTALTHLSIANNLITSCDQLHTKLGNLLFLDLSQNHISTLVGFSKLYSLETLNVGCNKIADIDEVAHVGELPCLENLILMGNVVTTIVDYRCKAFEQFGERAKHICLDNEKASQQELDKVSILRALRIVKEGRTPTFGGSITSFN